MKVHVIDLANYLTLNQPDSISGRNYGEQVAEAEKITDSINNNIRIIVNIDANKVKAINDSFIKGFFSKAFKKLKTFEKVNSIFLLQSDTYFERLFKKNWLILEAINKRP